MSPQFEQRCTARWLHKYIRGYQIVKGTKLEGNWCTGRFAILDSERIDSPRFRQKIAPSIRRSLTVHGGTYTPKQNRRKKLGKAFETGKPYIYVCRRWWVPHRRSNAAQISSVELAYYTPCPFDRYWPLKKGAANGRLHCGGEDPIKNEFLKLISKLGENKLIHPTQHTQNGWPWRPGFSLQPA
jgi:hypothetical protein